MNPFRRFIPLVLAALIGSCAAQTAPLVHYTISLADPAQHLLEVHILLPPGAAERELQLPVWNALYQIRNFSQYVNWVHARNRAGQPVSLRELDKSRWQIDNSADGAEVDYQIYADSPGPFGAELNPHHAFLNLAQILMYAPDLRSDPVNLRFTQVPDAWKIAIPLDSAPDKTFSAENYDRLVDSPVELGNFAESDFDENGGRYRVIVDADPADYDMQKVTDMLHKITSAATSWMQDRPFNTYTFIYHFPHGPAGGGMEHAYSTAIAVNADVISRAPEVLPSVSAHEFFHLWNVKRIRPQGLAPVNYARENYTRALWFSEGCTSTAADFIELRAGLLDERQFEQNLAAGITELERRPAHLTQSAEESSLDAWLEGEAYYRRPERSISYYNKGELLGIILDLAVREASQGHASLREVFEWMNENYAKKGVPFPEGDGVLRAAEAVAHADLGWFFSKYVSGTEDIPWSDFFRGVGLRVVKNTITVADPGFVASRNFDGPMTVGAVTPNSEAERAGLQTGDTLLEINGAAAPQDTAEITRLNQGDAITVKVRTARSAERELQWKVGGREEISYDIKDLESVTAAERARRTAWLKGEAENQAARPE
ncbi:MAG TPA: PDZ domain-containing protein [Candidatus Binatia bacterium]|nr:PDZ domain-containing protein [Candidatus Binatia bacterium]